MCDIDKYKLEFDGYIAHLRFEVSEIDPQHQDEVMAYVIKELIGGCNCGP